MEGSFISEVLPQRVRYSVFGYRSAAWNLGFSLSSFIAGGVIVRYGYGPSFVTYAVAMTAAMGLYYFYFRRIPDARQLALQEPFPEAPELVPQSEAPESFTLRPGRGEPAIFVSDVVDRLDAGDGPSPGSEFGTTDSDDDQTSSTNNQ